jgi:hypothetical protein
VEGWKDRRRQEGNEGRKASREEGEEGKQRGGGLHSMNLFRESVAWILDQTWNLF